MLRAGVVGRRPRPYLERVSTFFSRFSPFRAIRDLRLFLSQRHPYELGFLALSIVITTLLIAGFAKDSRIEKVYKRDIIYVENWRADRSDAEIRARLAKDAPIEAKRREERRQRLEARKAAFKRHDEQLSKWGL
jgi:hypothetical protein